MNVYQVETQPVVIEYLDDRGQARTYTPDVLVRYRRDVLPARDMPHLLVEVKYRDEYRGRFHELRQRFKAARAFARELGWVFRVLTDREIRTPYLDNARFLRPYREIGAAPQIELTLLEALQCLDNASPAMLLATVARDDQTQASYLPHLWKLVANFDVGVDLTQPLTMYCRIWRQVEGATQ
ncbi:hypothetical protein RHDC4_02787 [Rhodocyclaceae bacterium]|nr:hypothetical protein RHDC4_02787 [Rhodocyclaceae bacterium]